MKNKTEHTLQYHGQSLKNILYVWNGFNQNQKFEAKEIVETLVEDKSVMNLNLGKAPPGRIEGPGLGRGHPPENNNDPPVNPIQYYIKNKHINNDQNSNFYKLLIFTIMKKQILFLALFSLAMIFAGMNKSYAQTYINYVEGATVGCTPAVALTCASADDALHPLPGKVYTYSVAVAPATFTSIHWFVTDDLNVIASQAALTTDIDAVNGSYVLTATAPYNQATQTAASLDMSWKSFNGTTTPVLLVAYVKGASGCSDNVEVFRIEPTFAFTLDLAGILSDGTATKTPEECLSPVESAIYNGTTSLTMNYGENWVFFSVNAANFVDSWMPTITAAASQGSTIGTIEWAYPADAKANAAGTWHPVTEKVMASAGVGGAVGATGECIVVRVQVDHGNIEHDASAAPEVVTLSVDGTMFDPAAAAAAAYSNVNLKDLDNGTPSCVNNVTDTQTFTLTPRPSITTTVVGGFEPKL